MSINSESNTCVLAPFNTILAIPVFVEINSHSFRVCGKVNVNLFNILAVVYEIDLFPNWFPFVDKAELLGTPTRFRKFTRVRAKLPWPLSSREAYVIRVHVTFVVSRFNFYTSLVREDIRREHRHRLTGVIQGMR